VVFALPSSGLHTNGYSLVRRVFFEKLGMTVDDVVDEFGCTVGEELLKTHLSYLAHIEELQRHVNIKGLAHITGGGIVENFPRILPGGCGAVIERGAWTVLPIFNFIREKGDVSEREMYRVFNMGLGMLIVVGAAKADKVPGRLGSLEVRRVGEITAGNKVIDFV